MIPFFLHRCLSYVLFLSANFLGYSGPFFRFYLQWHTFFSFPSGLANVFFLPFHVFRVFRDPWTICLS
jgi:hypothetical protein